MKRSCKLCWSLSVLLFLGIAGMAYVFGIRGNVIESNDGRTAIVISADERDLVLGEMRGFLEAIETITVGLGEDDMSAIGESAKKMGAAAATQVPLGLMAKLPLEFKTMGMATHKAFDALSLEAEEMGDKQVVLTGLGELLNNCTTCHAAYRLEISDSKGN